VRWLVDDGATVAEGVAVAVLDAMKMETPVVAHRSGTLDQRAAVGEMISADAVLGRIGLPPPPAVGSPTPMPRHAWLSTCGLSGRGPATAECVCGAWLSTGGCPVADRPLLSPPAGACLR